MFAVKTESLVKKYGKLTALDDVSLAIEEGEIFALLGPNGAGKTTWISAVCGLLRPTSGTASVFGHDVVKDPVAARQCLGLVPQEINFDPFFTPREALRFQLGYYNQPRDEGRIREVLEALSLDDKADSDARVLSGGMKRRLLIAKALVHRPRVAFLDEPTAGVDVGLRRDLWAYVRLLREQGMTIVLTTHYLEEAQQLADRVAVIDGGKLRALDTTGQLLAQFGKKLLRFTVAGNATTATLPDTLRARGARLEAIVEQTEDSNVSIGAQVATSAKMTVIVPAPAATDAGGLQGLLAEVGAFGAILDIATEQPTLEQVFFSLTTSPKAAASAAAAKLAAESQS